MHRKSNDNPGSLKEINEEIVAAGESLPLIKLKDGTLAQTGTVAALMSNIIRYDQGEREGITAKLELALPTLVKIGFFDLFTPEEWIAGGSPGRALVGAMAQKHLKNAAVIASSLEGKAF